MPWKNLKGVTEEIERVPNQERYLWRLSLATVAADTEFSLFSGYDRLLVVIDGAGVYLNEKKLEPLQPIRFRGEEPIASRLISGVVRDLGLIFDRSKIEAEMICFANGCPDSGKRADVHYIFDLDSGDTHKDIPLASCSVKRGVLISIIRAE